MPTKTNAPTPEQIIVRPPPVSLPWGPEDAQVVTVMRLHLDAEGRVVAFQFDPINEQFRTAAALAAYKVAIRCHEAAQGKAVTP